MISVNGLKVEFSARTLFKDVSFVINEHDKIALMGKNGAGKSTMMKIIAGVQKPNAEVFNVLKTQLLLTFRSLCSPKTIAPFLKKRQRHLVKSLKCSVKSTS